MSTVARLAFWLQLPALVLLCVAVGFLIDVAGDAPGENMFGGIVLFFDAMVLFILLVTMSSQTLQLVRRPQSLTDRALPRPIAVLQLTLYGVIALWVALLVTIDIFALSVVFIAAIITVCVLLQKRIFQWAPRPVAPLTDSRVSLPLRFALMGYSLLAIAAVAYVVATLVDPTVDADGLRPLVLLMSFGLPLSLVALPLALLGALALGPAVFALPLAAILVNVVTAQLLLFSPRVRVRLVNRFFRLNGEEPATTVTGPSF